MPAAMRGMAGVRCRETLNYCDFLENMGFDLPTVLSPLVPVRGFLSLGNSLLLRCFVGLNLTFPHAFVTSRSYGVPCTLRRSHAVGMHHNLHIQHGAQTRPDY